MFTQELIGRKASHRRQCVLLQPVYLKMDLINDAGTVPCCTSCDTSSSDKRVLCFGNVAVCEPASWSCSSLSLNQGGSALTLRLDTSSTALAADCFLAPPHASLSHEPYTPESMETPTSSPTPIRIQRDFGEIEVIQWKSGADDEEVSDTDIVKSYQINVSGQMCSSSSKEQLSIIQEDSLTKNFISERVLEFSKDSNGKLLSDTVDGINSGQNDTLYQGVPHVFICYSDAQEPCLYDVDSSGENAATHKTDQNVLDVKNTHLERYVNNFIEEPPETTKEHMNKSYDGSGMFSSISITTTEGGINDKQVIFQENLISSLLLKTSSLDGILPTASGSPSLPSLSPQSMKRDCDTQIVEGLSYSAEGFLKTFSDVIAENEHCASISSEVIEIDAQENQRVSFESISVLNHINSSHSMNSHSQCSNGNEGNLVETKCNVSNNEKIYSGPFSTNDLTELKSEDPCTELAMLSDLHDRDKVPLSVYPESVMDIKVKYTKKDTLHEKKKISVNSQDCINVVSTELSSQLKRTKEQIPKYAKDSKLKTSSNKSCSSCCAII